MWNHAIETYDSIYFDTGSVQSGIGMTLHTIRACISRTSVVTRLSRAARCLRSRRAGGGCGSSWQVQCASSTSGSMNPGLTWNSLCFWINSKTFFLYFRDKFLHTGTKILLAFLLCLRCIVALLWRATSFLLFLFALLLVHSWAKAASSMYGFLWWECIYFSMDDCFSPHGVKFWK